MTLKKSFILAFAMIFLACVAPVGSAEPQGRPIKLVLSRRSIVDPVEITKHLSQKCPNVTLTTNEKSSNYMLVASGWSGNYRFMVIAHGGDMIYATETALLSNAVKDVCHFLNTQPAPGGEAPASPQTY